MTDTSFNIEFDCPEPQVHTFFFPMKAEKYSIPWYSDEEIWELYTSKAFFVKTDYNISCFIAWLVCRVLW